MARLSHDQLAEALKSLPDWQQQNNALIRSLKFADFVQLMQFVNQMAKIAEAADHHPDFTVNYNLLHISLSTHSAGGITEQDLLLAAQLNDLLNEPTSS